jgi:anti-sigma factor RsiW
MNCAVSRRWLDAYFDCELEPISRFALEAHLASCPACKRAAVKAAKLRSFIRADIRSYEPPRELKPRIQELLKKLASLE